MRIFCPVIPPPFVPKVMTQFPPVALPPVPNADFTPPAPTPPTPGKNPPKKAINPSPLTGAVDVLNPVLSWSNGGGATSYDVWFNGAFIGNQPGTTYNPGVLANSTPFTWRIDAVNADGTTTGTTWNFTTGVVVPFSYDPPYVIVSWVDSLGSNSGTLAEFLLFADQPTVTSLVFSNAPTPGFPPGIAVLAGLSSLPALQTLVCAHESLATLDFSGNPALNSVDISVNPNLTSVIPNTAVVTLDCHDCVILPALDVHVCAALTTLDCHGCTLLTALTSTSSLVTLNCASCAIVTLDVHTCIHLTTLNCSLNPTMTTLLVVGCSAIVSIDCHGCHLPDLHCTGLTTLQTLNCSGNGTGSGNTLSTIIGIGTLSALVNLDCNSQGVLGFTLNLSGLSNLATLHCQVNTFPTLNISTNTALLDLNAQNCNLSVLTVDTILFDLDAAGLLNGTVRTVFQVPPSAPDAGPPDGATAKANLIGKGWTATTD